MKSNYGRLAPVERHRIEEVVLPGTLDPADGRPIVTSRMTFVEVAEDVDGATILTPAPGGREPEKEREAERFLLDELADGDWHDSAELKERAAAAGVTERTLKRAKLELGVEDRRTGYPSITQWRRRRSRAEVASESAGRTVEPAPPSQNGAAAGPVGPLFRDRPVDGPTVGGGA